MLGLWLWLSAASTPVEKRGALVVKLVFGNLCVALVAGCRPQMELFAFWPCPSSGRGTSGKSGCAAAPGGGVRCIYPAGRAGRRRADVVQRRAVRFASDFGANYNLTGNDMTQRGFNAVRIGPAVFTSLFELPSWQGVFPSCGRRTSRRTPSSAPSAKFTGGMLAATPYLWVLAMPLFPRSAAVCTAAVSPPVWSTAAWPPWSL